MDYIIENKEKHMALEWINFLSPGGGVTSTYPRFRPQGRGKGLLVEICSCRRPCNIGLVTLYLPGDGKGRQISLACEEPCVYHKAWCRARYPKPGQKTAKGRKENRFEVRFNRIFAIEAENC